MKSVKPIYIAFLLWMLVKAGLFIRLGVVVANDSPRYINYAQHLLSGGKITADFDSNYIFYSVIIAFFQKTGLGLQGVVFFQVFFSGLALWFLYALAVEIFGKRSFGITAMIVYAGWIFAQQWDFYILTDSLFSSFCIWIAYLVICYNGRFKEALILTLIILLSTLRPNGFVMGIAFAAYLLYDLSQSDKRLFVKVISCVPFLALLLIYYLNGALKSYFPSLIYGNYLEGEIISGYKGLLLNTDEVIFPDPKGQPVPEMLMFVINNPVFALKMFVWKVFFFFSHIRPYYSRAHNLIIALVIYPAYIFGIKTLIQKEMERSSKVFFVTFIACQALVVGLYMDDWDGRFLLPVLPFVFLLASPQISRLFDDRVPAKRVRVRKAELSE